MDNIEWFVKLETRKRVEDVRISIHRKKEYLTLHFSLTQEGVEKIVTENNYDSRIMFGISENENRMYFISPEEKKNGYALTPNHCASKFFFGRAISREEIKNFLKYVGAHDFQFDEKRKMHYIDVNKEDGK